MGINIMRIPGLITKSWVIDSSVTTETTSRTNAYDGDRETSFNIGGSLSSRDGHCYVTLTATLPGAMRIDRIYAKGSTNCEEGGNEASHNRYMYLNVNGSTVYSEVYGGRGMNGYVMGTDDFTVREDVTVVEFILQTNYHRPSNENNSGFASCSFLELEIYGDGGGNYGVML